MQDSRHQELTRQITARIERDRIDADAIVEAIGGNPEAVRKKLRGWRDWTLRDLFAIADATGKRIAIAPEVPD